MSQPPDLEARVAALESRVGDVAAEAQAARAEVRVAREDAAAARHLAAARDRDIADLAVKVDAVRSTLKAHGVQSRERFDAVDRRLDALEHEMRSGFAEMRGKFDATAAGMEQIVRLLTTREQHEE